MSKATEHDGKQAHATKAEALAHRRFLMRSRGAIRLRVYKCEHCPNFHVGHLRRVPNGRRPTK